MKTQIKDIEKMVCDWYGVNPIDLHTKSRKRITVMIPRQIIAILAGEIGYHDKVIGDYFEGLDRNTIRHAKKEITVLYNKDCFYRREINMFRMKLGLREGINFNLDSLIALRDQCNIMIKFVQDYDCR